MKVTRENDENNEERQYSQKQLVKYQRQQLKSKINAV